MKAVIDKTAVGMKQAVSQYGPFGEVIRATGPMAKANPFRFSTKYQDDETDLLYYGYRYYNASTGRWPNRDPLNELGARVLIRGRERFDLIEDKNLYKFVSNDSINRWDKLGKKCCLLTWNIGSLPGGGSTAYGHSALKCDDGTYVSAYPSGGDMGTSPVDWHTPETDSAHLGAPDSTICSDCIDQSKVAAWFQALRAGSPNYDGTTANCADYSQQGITAGLDPDKQKKKTCPCSLFVSYLLVDLMNPSGLKTPGGVADALKQLNDNGCNRYKCVASTSSTGLSY